MLSGIRNLRLRKVPTPKKVIKSEPMMSNLPTASASVSRPLTPSVLRLPRVARSAADIEIEGYDASRVGTSLNAVACKSSGRERLHIAVTSTGGLLHGFSPTLWCAIATNAAGGMIVAAVMKYAGNILRSFAQASLGEYSRRILSAE